MMLLSDLNVGDKVGVCSGSWEVRCELRCITRKTATRLVLDDGSRWTMRGRKVGESSSYHFSHLVKEAEALDISLREIADAIKRHRTDVPTVGSAEE